MKKLFLASSFKDVANIFADFEKDLKGKTVTFIPTASKVEKVVFYVNSGKKALQKLGLIIDELDISTASNDEINSKLRNNDFIYITDGNTFFLIQELKKTGANKIIIDEINKGKLYIGESAGAIVTSANIEYAKRMDDVKKAPVPQARRAAEVFIRPRKGKGAAAQAHGQCPKEHGAGLPGPEGREAVKYGQYAVSIAGNVGHAEVVPEQGVQQQGRGQQERAADNEVGFFHHGEGVFPVLP